MSAAAPKTRPLISGETPMTGEERVAYLVKLAMEAFDAFHRGSTCTRAARTRRRPMRADTLRDDCPDPSCRMGHGDGTWGPTCETCGGTGWVVKTMDDLRDEVAQLRENAQAMTTGGEWRKAAEAKVDRLEALVEMWCGGMVAEAAE